MTLEDAARAAGVSASALSRWARAGTLLHWRRGRRVYVRLADVLALFEEVPAS